jgi:hypothetical protein
MISLDQVHMVDDEWPEDSVMFTDSKLFSVCPTGLGYV